MFKFKKLFNVSRDFLRHKYMDTNWLRIVLRNLVKFLFRNYKQLFLINIIVNILQILQACVSAPVRLLSG